ncbi:peptidase inhibitor family I36 protein [Nocardia sp. NPDC052254]|uniref:peptidase inhibitor family I36 protein n=1 Tax=Nocardia sp. NPDC052254 TaxID=3155681 RepID=UPI00343B37F1
MRAGIAFIVSFVVALMMVGAPGANAADGCPGGSVCMWSGANYSGTPREWIPKVEVAACLPTYPEGGTARSVANSSGESLTFWENGNCTGRSTNAATTPSDFGFDAASVSWCKPC